MTNAKPVQIFRIGRHVAADGRKIDFTEAMLKASVAAYDPALHEAPAVVGHPKHNLPAYGWAQSLSFADGVISANLDQVNPDFAELVNNGAFKKISASFYAPDSENNPKPGVYYLRHIGFLGAQPPAVKGLKSAEFADGETGIVSFADVGWSWPVRQMAQIAQGFREFIISKFSIDDADKIAPAWQIQSLEDAATRADALANPTYSEQPNHDDQEIDTVKQQELEAREGALTGKETAISTRETAIAAREASFAERETKVRKDADLAFLDGLAAKGQITPALKPQLVEFMAGLEATDTVQFAEGEANKKTPHAFFRDLLAGAGKVVDFSERASAEAETDKLPDDPQARGEEIAARALNFQEAERGAGRRVPTGQEAVAHIKKTTAEKK